MSAMVSWRAFLMIALLLAKSSSRVIGNLARPCSMAFMPTATASRGKTSHSSMVGVM